MVKIYEFGHKINVSLMKIFEIFSVAWEQYILVHDPVREIATVGVMGTVDGQYFDTIQG